MNPTLTAAGVYAADATGLQARGTGAALTNGAARNDPRLRETAQSFEAVLLGQLTGLMLEATPVNETFGGGQGEEMFRSMLSQEIGKSMARRGGIGLSQPVLDQMIRLQDAAALSHQGGEQ